ncbi:DNA-binding protein RHL1 isoform X2 [Mangifera indica]|uniref:DNA-binding protein RHL1 isoform X2 n=1 Tax=Mangifera indica TaxID=29780 RepID=UPI001CF9620D|nr:DNA-binding protein RHL1 isoform X2 [Mangifera indica]
MVRVAVRDSSPPPSKKKKQVDKDVERTRLKTLAFKKKMLSDIPAKGFTPLNPTNQVIKHHGKDILRKSSLRKNRYLFSFPGLLAPISNGGGKIGELKNLGTQNPVLYLDFPQGQMKLFGTIVYPENRYLTLQFSRGGKNVTCEDYFDNMIVFSDAWWVGKKDENLDEVRLDFPKELSEGKNSEYDFKGGVGAASVNKQGVFKSVMKDSEEKSIELESDDDISDVDLKFKDMMEVTPVRHSERTAGKRFKFAEVSSEDDPAESDADMPEGDKKKGDISTSKKTNVTKSKQPSSSHCGVLVQTSISALFNKVVEKADNPRKKGKLSTEKSTGTESTAKENGYEFEDDNIAGSTSPETSNGSGGWAAF